jgi:hypothetical protein
VSERRRGETGITRKKALEPETSSQIDRERQTARKTNVCTLAPQADRLKGQTVTRAAKNETKKI